MKKEKQVAIIENLLLAMETPKQRQKTRRDFGNQRNPETGTYYRGVNAFSLSYCMQKKGYEHGQRLTFKGVGKKNGLVKKGEKGTEVIYYSPLKVIDPKEKDGYKMIPILKSYFVFNISQTTIEPVEKEKITEEIFGSYDLLDNVLTSYGMRENIEINTSTTPRCFYSPTNDKVSMVDKKYFTSKEAYYQTLCHEFIHSTGHKTRLDRKLKGYNHENDKQYSIEELVAEFGSCILSSRFFDIDLENSGSYLASRASHIRDTEKQGEVIKAITQANKAVDFIRG